MSNYAERRQGLEKHIAKFSTPRLTDEQKPVIPGREAPAPPPPPQKKAEKQAAKKPQNPKAGK